jgi:hypothetical protein
MTFAAPSIARDYRLISALDPALDSPVQADDESADAWKVRLDAWHDRLRVAREQGDWSSLLADGKEPTLFVCRHVPGDIWAMRQRVLSGMGLEEQMGHIVRLALVGIENGPPDWKVKLAQHHDLDGKPTGFGKCASPEIIQKLTDVRDDKGIAIGAAIVNELGALIATRQMGAPPGK